jgi:hypothetical protein
MPVTGMTLIHHRPAGVLDRVEPGHLGSRPDHGPEQRTSDRDPGRADNPVHRLGHLMDARHNSATVRGTVVAA